MSVFQNTIRDLTEIARRSPRVCVAYSGGKDSLAVIDLCSKLFSEVVAFQWFCVSGLEVCEAPLRMAKVKWGVDVMRIPHWDMVNAMKSGVWCDATPAFDGIPDLDLKRGYAFALASCEAQICATGMKEADGMQRRQFFANIRDSKDPVWRKLIHPCREWTKRQVEDYLKSNGIELPRIIGGTISGGVGLTHRSICWMHDNAKEDYAKFLKWYPYAEAAIKRREWFGVGKAA